MQNKFKINNYYKYENEYYKLLIFKVLEIRNKYYKVEYLTNFEISEQCIGDPTLIDHGSSMYNNSEKIDENSIETYKVLYGFNK